MTRSLFSPAYGRLREALVAARHAQRLSQADVARALGRPQTFVSKYERGERRLDLVEVIEIAQVVGLDPTALVGEIANLAPPGPAQT